MRIRLRAAGVSTTALLLVTGMAYAYTVSPSPATEAHGTLADGQLSISWPPPAGMLTLDVPQQLEIPLVATGQVIRVNHVLIEPDAQWDVAKCGKAADDFQGVNVDLPHPIVLQPGEDVLLDESNAWNVKVTLKNDPLVDQTKCVLKMRVTVS